MERLLLQQISENIASGRPKAVRNLVRQALGEGMPAKRILDEGLLAGIDKISRQFKANQVFVPEILLAVRAMNAGMDVIEQQIQGKVENPIGRVIIGTIKGDMHDIGKNVVAMMFKSYGFEVFDLGVDVEPEQFIKKAEEVDADIICISALLTTTMLNIKEVIDRMGRKRLRDKYIVMVGGAPVTKNFADQIGSDIYTPDAVTAAETAREIIRKKRAAEDNTLL